MRTVLVLTLALCPPSQSWVDIDPNRVKAHMGWVFRAAFPTADVESAMISRDVRVTRGAHGWRGRWLVNGAGRPIVASNITGYAELLGPAGGARLAAPGDAASLAYEIRLILRDASLAHALGERGAAAAKRYDWDTIARRLEEIYRSCAEAEVKLDVTPVYA